MKPLLIHGMHGLGDNLHQRALLRQLMPGRYVWLESSWVSPYHDLIPQGLRIVRKSSGLRTQAKNADREAALFAGPPPAGCDQVRVWYKPEMVRRCGSVLGAMCAHTGCDVTKADFRLPIPAAWDEKAQAWLDRWQPQKPLLIYRPLIMRREWSGCAARNPDHAAYAELIKAIRDRFFVLSIADIVANVEWIVGEPFEADAYCHAGELDFETLAALTRRAALVYCSPGFAAVLGQAVETPVVCVFGGYENSTSFAAGARFSPYLGIDPINPCHCFQHSHNCQKAIDMPRALATLKEFISCCRQ